MKLLKIFIIFIITTFFIISCIDEYNHNIKDYENILVIQGMITNNDGPYDIFIKKSIPLTGYSSYNEIQDAIVTIRDNNNNEEILTEISPGHYQTSKNGIKGIIGNTYILNVITDDGNVYESDPVTLKEVPKIDSIYPVYKEVYSFEDNKYIKGIELIVETEEWNQGNNYFLRWDYTEVWQTKPKWKAIQTDEEFADTCWQVNSSQETIIENTASYNTNKMKKSILYIGENSPKPFYKYDIKINQYSINETNYYFWKMLKETSENNGNIYDQVPYSPISNLNCINNENINILGFFDACSVSSKILTLKAPIFDIPFYDFNSVCTYTNLPLEDYSSDYQGWTYVIEVTQRSITFTFQKYCVDCMEYSTTQYKPIL